MLISFGVSHRLFLFDNSLLLLGASVLVSLCAWLRAAEWAVAIIVLDVDDPMTVLKIMGLSILRWLCTFLSFLHMVWRVDMVLVPCCIEDL